MNITEFYNTYKGKYVDKNGKTTSYVQNGEPFGGQCVSLVQAFMLKVCGIPVKARGHAKNFGDSLIASKLAKAININNLKDGDIVVYPNLSTPYGHIGIYYKGKVFEQNPQKATLTPLRSGKIWAYRLNAYKHPTPQKKAGFPTGFKKFSKVRTYQCKENMNIRSSYSTTSKIHSKKMFKKGQTFKTLGYIDANGYRWFEVTWGGRTSVGWVAEAPLKYAQQGRKKAEKYFYLKDITK